jgi:protein-L-isoaspartate(D-aspartate) O-methyltransferase
MFNLDDCRLFYAEEVQLAANVSSKALVGAFGRVPREKFLGHGPWYVAVPDVVSSTVQYVLTADDDPRHVYHNVLIALDRSHDLNNGQPATLAQYIDALKVTAGDRVYHLGAGTGYYTAIIAELVGSGGEVVATEVHSKLGGSAKINLADRSNVSVHVTDGAAFDPGKCNAMLINAGVTHPHLLWLNRLREGGRLLVPITVSVNSSIGHGVMLRITRQADAYPAEVVGFTAIYSVVGGRDEKREQPLRAALANGTLMKVKSVRTDPHDADESCVVHGGDVCLSTRAIPVTPTDGSIS